ncbi:O(6)-methylguanine-induced apoptosis 2 isoform X2 [Brienomyrus brachyistius]|uniref:O(6)-methylguanine-induced apoptosis 2 isoform X2 n=1 Tax=Brienomyrus brachyistius TaxID=42636 RepID=UPI0020B2D471|nr:O(6)-methylguanine-induced apoptosis 2 isoform X2 [Brienomyrus brachyistius]
MSFASPVCVPQYKRLRGEFHFRSWLCPTERLTPRCQDRTSLAASRSLQRYPGRYYTKEKPQMDANGSLGPASIPTRYQIVVKSNTDKKGFSSGTKRFISKDVQSDTPGPGSYISQQSADLISPSFSTKGTGGFASQAARMPRPPRRCTPGPSVYNLQASLLSKFSSAKGCTRVFCMPIAVKVEVPQNQTPAPNQYHVSFNGVERNSTVSARSSFVSKTSRSGLHHAVEGPSPCHYAVNDALTKTPPKVPVSCFKSGSSRIQPPVISQAPGPGTYKPNQPPEPIKRTIFPKKHYLVLAASAVPMPKTPPLPGPGQYNIVDYKGPHRKCMSSAVFMSGTSRWIGETGRDGLPGPGLYDPRIPAKQSFLYNISKRWIPA